MPDAYYCRRYAMITPLSRWCDAIRYAQSAGTAASMLRVYAAPRAASVARALILARHDAVMLLTLLYAAV